MATPEQNALLAIQLFGAPAEQFNQQNNARTNLLLNLTNRNREEQLKRDLANQSYEKALELARYSGDREDTRQLGAERRQKNQLEAMQTREDTRATEAERRQTASLDAREKQQIVAEMNRLYPQYAAAAARAGAEIKQRSEFDESNEGLGQLAAELRTAEVGFEQKKMGLAADASIAELDEAKGALGTAKNRLLELSKPSPDDEKFARQRAVSALKQAIESGQLESTKKLRKDAISKGLAELSKGNDETATKFLGEEAIGAYQGAFDQTLMSLPNMKARLQERAQAQQQLMQLQTVTARIESDLRKGAAANPFLAEKLTKSRTSLQEMMSPAEPSKKSRSLDEIFQKPGAGSATPGTTDADPEQKQTSAPTYKYPALSLFGLGERMGAGMPTAGELAMAPANIAAFPGRVIDTAGRVGSAGLQGLMTGDYTVPDKGLIEMAGEGIGGLIGGNPYAPPQRSLFGADNPGRQADIDRMAQLIEWLRDGAQTPAAERN